MEQASEAYAIVMMPGSGPPRLWPTRGRAGESLEAHCATFGITLVQAYPSLEEALAAICLPLGDWLAKRPEEQSLRGV